MKLRFIWGAGGVGKTHVVLRESYLAAQSSKTRLLTLDPSERLFHLLNLSENAPSVSLLGNEIELKKLQAHRLFEELERKKPTSPRVRAFYDRMVMGLQDFRDYLTLIQLGDELESTSADLIVVDTPPLQEALGLVRAIQHLRSFFDAGLVQLALKSSQFSLFQASLKKLFELSRFFVGKRATDQVFELLQWLSTHAERFHRSSRLLEQIMTSSQTEHLLIITPETSPQMIELFQKSISSGTILFNRSVIEFPDVPERALSDPFVREMIQLKKKEQSLRSYLGSQQEIRAIPFLLMGDDTLKELERFIQTEELLGNK